MQLAERRHGAASDGARGRVSFMFQEFVHAEALGGLLLLATAVVALVWANSPWVDASTDLWTTEVTIGTNHFGLTRSGAGRRTARAGCVDLPWYENGASDL